MILIQHNLVSIYKGVQNSELITDKNYYSIHRIDNKVTGLLLVAHNQEDQIYYKKLFKERKVTKLYVGEVFGSVKNSVTKIVTKIKYDKNLVKSFVHSSGKWATTYMYKYKKKNQQFFVIK